jgi:hypothetical protein
MFSLLESDYSLTILSFLFGTIYVYKYNKTLVKDSLERFLLTISEVILLIATIATVALTFIHEFILCRAPDYLKSKIVKVSPMMIINIMSIGIVVNYVTHYLICLLDPYYKSAITCLLLCACIILPFIGTRTISYAR